MNIPVSIIVALAVQQFCQIIKFIIYSVRDRRISFHYLTSSGGMPSAHSAFVTALCVSVGVRSGMGSETFAVAAVLAFIVIHDAFRVRGALQEVIHILKADHPENEHAAAALPETVGHNSREIVAGIIIALCIALPVSILLK